jgi:hypothetical protein
LDSAVYKGLGRIPRKRLRRIFSGLTPGFKDFAMASQYDDLPSKDELQRRRGLVEDLKKIRAAQSESDEPFPSAEEMIREDRER